MSNPFGTQETDSNSGDSRESTTDNIGEKVENGIHGGKGKSVDENNEINGNIENIGNNANNGNNGNNGNNEGGVDREEVIKKKRLSQFDLTSDGNYSDCDNESDEDDSDVEQ